MKLLKHALVNIVIALSIQCLFAAEKKLSELPTDPVLSLNDQEHLFVKAYEGFNPIDIHPIKTSIPGLAPMIRMHYSYVAELVKESPVHLDLLEQFWQHTSEIIQSNLITIGRMRSITMQLALLLTDMQKGKLEGRSGGVHYQLYQNNLWKDLKNYRDEEFYVPTQRAFQPHPFYCSAVLCCKTGGFSYKRFLDNYLERPFVLHLAALALRNPGVHGGLYVESSDFLDHDFGHNEMLNIYGEFNQKELNKHPETKDLIYWDTLRSLLKTIRMANLNPKLNERALFLMLHETVPSFLGDDQFQMLELPEQERLPFMSVRKLFLGAVANSSAYTKIDSSRNRVLMNIVFSCPTPNTGEKPWRCNSVQIRYKMGTSIKNIDGTFAGILNLVKVFPPQSNKGISIPQSLEVGTFTVHYDILPSDNPHKEKIRVLKGEGLSFSEAEQRHLLPEECQIIAADISEWSYSFLIDTQLTEYLVKKKDSENMLRELYEDNSYLPPVGTPLSELSLAVDKEMKRFWREFYLTNKNLFPDTALLGGGVPVY